MKTYRNPQGQVTGTSKSMQGGCCGLIAGLFALAFLIGIIAGAFQH